VLFYFGQLGSGPEEEGAFNVIEGLLP